MLDAGKRPMVMASGWCGGLVAGRDVCLDVGAESDSNHLIGILARFGLHVGRLPFQHGITLAIHIESRILHDGHIIIVRGEIETVEK